MPQRDKRFSVYYRNGYAVLKVPPPLRPEDRVYPEEVINRMKILQIPMVRRKVIEEIIARADGSRAKLVEWPSGAQLSPGISLKISPDKMGAEALITPPRIGGGTVTREQFEHALEDNRITTGINWAAIDLCTEQEIYNRPVAVAQGLPPVHGRGGRVRYLFNTERGKPFKELPHGRIDLKELNFIQFKRQGDLLAEREAPVSPKDGFDIYGQVVPAKPMGEEEPLLAGASTELRGDKIYALEDGNVRIDKGSVLIEPVVTVDKVDYGTGNLEFDGSVIVKGSVADGFTVKASGDVQVGKSVGRVLIEAGRNVILQAGINGDKEGCVRAGGDLYARFVESSLLEIRGSLIVTGSILHSTLNVSGHLLLEGGRSEILGGLGVVRGWVKCRKIGSLYETRTNLIVGVEPEELEDFLELVKRAAELRARQDELDRQIGYFRKKVAQTGPSEETVLQGRALEKELQTVTAEIEAMSKRIQQIRKTLQPGTDCFVLAEDIIYPGAKVSFGMVDFSPDRRGAKRTLLQYKEGRIRESGYNPAQPPEEILRLFPRPEKG